MNTDVAAPTLSEIRAARERLGDLVVETPVWWWRSREITDHLDVARGSSSSSSSSSTRARSSHVGR